MAGTGTILLAAKKRALIESVSMTLDQLAAAIAFLQGLRAEITRWRTRSISVAGTS
jgi:hypothetical protein